MEHPEVEGSVVDFCCRYQVGCVRRMAWQKVAEGRPKMSQPTDQTPHDVAVIQPVAEGCEAECCQRPAV